MIADRRRDLEHFCRQFLRAEIAIALTYTRLAITAYADGHLVHGKRIAAKAAHAKADVAGWLEEAEERGWDVADLNEEYQALRAALMKLPPPLQMAA